MDRPPGITDKKYIEMLEHERQEIRIILDYESYALDTKLMYIEKLVTTLPITDHADLTRLDESE